jgi:hypothetical protein
MLRVTGSTLCVCILVGLSLVVGGGGLRPGLATATGPDEKHSFDLTGTWSCDFEGTYSVRQIGKTVWWLGTSKDDGKEWSHVFHGVVEKKGDSYVITGEWADLPRGKVQQSGTLKLSVEGDKLRAIEQTGGFGAKDWKRKKE